MQGRAGVRGRPGAILVLATVIAGCTEDPSGPPAGSLDAVREASKAPLVARTDDVTGTIRTLMGRVPTTGGSAEERARGFLDAYGALFGVADPAADLRLGGAHEVAGGSTVVVFDRQVGGARILGAAIRVRLDPEGNVAYVATADPGPAEGPESPVLSPEEAIDAAATAAELTADPVEAGAPESLRVSTALLLDDEEQPSSRLAWVVDLVAAEVDDGAELRVAVDAETGAPLGWWSTEHDALPRRTFTAAGSSNRAAAVQAATLWLDENGPVAGQNPDADARAAHDDAGIAQTYFEDTHDLDAYSDLVTRLDSYVHFVYIKKGHTVLNASYSSKYDALFYSDGMASLDVVTHELTHGVTGFHIGLVGLAVPGALGESLSDVFAAFVDTQTQWTIGDGCARGVIRDLADPTRFGQPRHYDDRRLPRGGRCDDDTPCPEESACLNGRCYEIEVDAGYKHYNSGITNHAAYLLVAGGQGNGRTSGVRVRGIGQPRAEQIYGCGLLGFRLGETPRFGDLRDALLDCCLDLVEHPRPGREALGTRDCGSVINAFAAVGIGAPDGDSDARDDAHDNCPALENFDQVDADRNGVGDACENAVPPPDLTICRWMNQDGTSGSGEGGAVEISGDLTRPTFTITGPGAEAATDYSVTGGHDDATWEGFWGVTSCEPPPDGCFDYATDTCVPGPTLPAVVQYGSHDAGTRVCSGPVGALPEEAPDLQPGGYYGFVANLDLGDTTGRVEVYFTLWEDASPCR